MKLQVGSFAEAIDQYQQAMGQKEVQYQLYGNMAIAYAQMNRSKDTILAAEKAIESADRQGQR